MKIENYPEYIIKAMREKYNIFHSFNLTDITDIPMGVKFKINRSKESFIVEVIYDKNSKFFDVIIHKENGDTKKILKLYADQITEEINENIK